MLTPMPHRPRILNHVYAVAKGYFWMRCPLCGENFGGHEVGEASVDTWVSPDGRQRGGFSACWRHGTDETLYG